MSLFRKFFGEKDPKDQRQEMEQRFAVLSTAELEAIIRKPDSYTPLALKAARSTLASRSSQKLAASPLLSLEEVARSALATPSPQKPAASEPESPQAGPQLKVVGVLVLSQTEVQNQSGLFWEIAIQQSRLGFRYGGPGGTREVVQVARGGFDDAYVYAAIRANFADLGGDDLMSRTYSYDFTTSDGATRGKYYAILDQPKP
jgi:hypothetical protein